MSEAGEGALGEPEFEALERWLEHHIESGYGNRSRSQRERIYLAALAKVMRRWERLRTVGFARSVARMEAAEEAKRIDAEPKVVPLDDPARRARLVGVPGLRASWFGYTDDPTGREAVHNVTWERVGALFDNPKHRAIVLAVLRDKSSHVEVATDFGVHRNWVDRLVGRARAMPKLRRLLVS